MKIYIFGWFGFNNTGDNLILQKEFEYMQEYFSNNTLTIVGNYSNLLNILGNETEFNSVDHNGKNYLKMFLKADFIIYGGGGLFPHQNTKQLLILLLGSLIMKIRNKRIGYIGLGIGGVQTKFDLMIWKLIIKMSSIFYTRDDVLLKQLKVEQNKYISEMPDIVFSLNNSKRMMKQISPGMVVSVALANIFINDIRKYEEFLEEMEKFFKLLLSSGYSVKLYSFTKGVDEKLNNDLCSRLNSSQCICISYSEKDDIIDTFVDSDIIISMRFHGCVLSAIYNIPFIGISYSHKTEALMNKLDVSDFIVKYCRSENEYYGEVINIEYLELWDIFNKLNTDYEIISDKLRLQTVNYSHQVSEKFKLLKDLLKENQEDK